MGWSRPCISWNSKVRYRVYNSPSPAAIFIWWSNPRPISSRSSVILSSTFAQVFWVVSFLQATRLKVCIQLLPLTPVLLAPHIEQLLIKLSETWCVQCCTLFCALSICVSPDSSGHFVLLCTATFFLTQWGRSGSFKLFKRRYRGF